MLLICVLVLMNLLEVSGFHQIYSDSVASRNLSTDSYLYSELPRIYFLNQVSPYWYQNQVTLEYGISNVPSVMLIDGRIRVGLWMCSYAEKPCTNDEHFHLVFSTINNAPNELLNDNIINFSFPPLNATIEAEGQHRLRLVMDLIDHHAPRANPRTSSIRPFMDEITVFRKSFELPTVDLWWNQNGPPEYVGEGTIGKSYFDSMVTALRNAFHNSSSLPQAVLDHYGMSGPQFRHFYNNLGALLPGDIHYLEIGIYAGSTMVSLLSGNGEKVRTVVGVDLWADGDWLGNQFNGMSNVKKLFETTLEQYIDTTKQHVRIMQADCWKVSPDTLLTHSKGEKFNVYLFDGPHGILDQFFAIVNFLPALADTFIFLVDDWNWERVRTGTESGLAALSDQLVVVGKVEILSGKNPLDQSVCSWHNGMAAFVVQKRTQLVDVVVN